MTRIRQQNVTAAQWSPNGEALGTLDLSRDDAYPFAVNVFSPQVQRERLSRRRLPQAPGRARDGRGSRPRAGRRGRRGDEGMGAREGRNPLHHMFQPLTGLTAEKHDSFFDLADDGTSIASSRAPSSSRASPTRPRSRPAASALRSRRAATRPGIRPARRSSSRTRTARCCASRRRSLRGRARRST